MQIRKLIVLLFPCALLGALVLRLWASDFLVTSEVTEGGQGLQLHFPSSTDVYFQVWSSDSMTGAWTQVRGMTLGADGTQSWTDTDAVGTFTGLYYRLRRIPMSSPHDHDGDGMDDVWELKHNLDPVNSADAAWDSDDDGISNYLEYLRGTDPTDPGSVNISFYADPTNGHDALNGLSPLVENSIRGPKRSIEAVLGSEIRIADDSVQMAGGVYPTSELDPDERNVVLIPLGNVVLE